jgi:predicted Zn-dependent peptidase
MIAGFPVAPIAAQQVRSPVQPRLSIPIDYYTLPNGLKVVLSRDTTAPTAVVAVYYNIGFRVEPRGRTGFAHLFEHLMFQGSENLGKMEFIQLVEKNGGRVSGFTRFDFTAYSQVIPSNALEPVLWAEADRMRGLRIDSANLRNQQEVVKNEVRVNVLNQPYGGFPLIDMSMRAFTNWHNAHNFYGEMTDLEAATLEDAAAFFRTYYVPGNAVLTVTGDFDPDQVKRWIAEYFAGIPRGPTPPIPDVSEPRQTAERRSSRTAPLATQPAIAIAYHVPERYTPEWYAFGIIDQMLGQGRDGAFHDELVRKRGLTGSVDAGINLWLGSMFDYDGPMLYIIQAFHDSDKPADSLIAAFDVAVEGIRTRPVSQAALDRALVKLRSNLYSLLEGYSGTGRANILTAFALFDDDPSRINRLEAEFARVTPELVLRTAHEYLAPTNRSILTIVPGAAAGAAPASGASTGPRR